MTQWIECDSYDRSAFAQLKAESPSLQALEQTAQLKAYKAGRNIFQEGDPGDGLYIIVEGIVQITCLVGQDQRRVLSRLGPGDFFVRWRYWTINPGQPRPPPRRIRRFIFSFAMTC